MTLNESETACGTSSPRLILSFSTPEILMKMVTAIRPTMMAPNRPLVPVLVVESTPVTSAVVTSSVRSGEAAARFAAMFCGIMMTSEEMPTTTQARRLPKFSLRARQ